MCNWLLILDERVIESTGQVQIEEKSKKEERPGESQSQLKESSTYQSNVLTGRFFIFFKGSQIEQPKSQSQSKKPDEQDLWDMACKI